MIIHLIEHYSLSLCKCINIILGAFDVFRHKFSQSQEIQLFTELFKQIITQMLIISQIFWLIAEVSDIILWVAVSTFTFTSGSQFNKEVLRFMFFFRFRFILSECEILIRFHFFFYFNIQGVCIVLTVMF